jgi:hypothetical protein
MRLLHGGTEVPKGVDVYLAYETFPCSPTGCAVCLNSVPLTGKEVPSLDLKDITSLCHSSLAPSQNSSLPAHFCQFRYDLLILIYELVQRIRHLNILTELLHQPLRLQLCLGILENQ